MQRETVQGRDELFDSVPVQKDRPLHSLTEPNLLFTLDVIQGHVYNPEWEQRRSWMNINELQPLDVVKQCFYGDAGIYFLLN